MSQFKPSFYAIDFGTSNSLLAAANAQQIHKPIPLDTFNDDPSILRSIFLSPSKEKWFFGQEAIDLYTEHTGEVRLFRSIKKFLPDPGFTGTQVHGKFFSIIDLVALFLKHMREKANTFFDCDVDSVVLGRPAAFSVEAESDLLAEKRLYSAAKIAGFKHISFCPEPVAAAYDYKNQLTKKSLVLIADFGGGTSDFSIIKMGPESLLREDVLALGGIPLAGDAYDGSIMKNKLHKHFGTSVTYKMPSGRNVMHFPKFLLSKLNSPADINFLARRDTQEMLSNMYEWCIRDEDRRHLRQLNVLIEEGLGYAIYKSIETSKKELSSKEESLFKYHHIAGVNIEENILQREFLEFSQPITMKIIESLQEVMKQAQVEAQDIDLVCITGGTAQLKGIQDALTKIFGREKLTQFRFFHSIINGLAVRAQELSRF